jgi:aryl-alcohol dehydrogenase-like predicted oxidoreductase
VINWTIHQPGITAALCGAKRPDQIRETAGAMGWDLTPDQQRLIDRAIAERGPAIGTREFK